MKTITFSFLLLLPLLLSAQPDDYCPCQEELGSHEAFLDLVSAVNEEIQSVSRQNTYMIDRFRVVQDSPADHNQALQKNVVPQATSESVNSVEPVKTTARSGTGNLGVKKKKKLFAPRAKARKKSKKYRGRCPAF